MLPETFAHLQAHAAWDAPRECCGLILDGPERYVPCRNIAGSANEFRIAPEDWLAAEHQGKILAVCHSHPGAACRPGPADVRGCETTGLPWYILGVDGLWRLDPAVYRSKLEGRPFRWGWADCYSLVRDYFGDLPDFPRGGAEDSGLYLEHYERLGFRKDTPGSLQPRDLVLMRVRGCWHAGIYVGDGRILHHLTGRLSRQELYDNGFQAATQCVLRRVA